MPLSSFFEELPQPSPQPFARADRITVSDPQAAELTRAFLSIDDHDLRDRVVDLMRDLSAEFLLAEHNGPPPLTDLNDHSSRLTRSAFIGMKDEM